MCDYFIDGPLLLPVRKEKDEEAAEKRWIIDVDLYKLCNRSR